MNAKHTITVPRLRAATCSLLVVDVQEKLLPAIPSANELLCNIEFMLDAAKMVEVPVRVTEQYPQGLGPTAGFLSGKLPAERPAKKSFSCCGAEGLVESLDQSKRPWVVLVGIETHVCMSQTAFDLLEQGFHVAIPVDAAASRFAADHTTALARLGEAGVLLTTVEAAAFEWFGTADHPSFRSFSQLVQARSKKIGGVTA